MKHYEKNNVSNIRQFMYWQVSSKNGKKLLIAKYLTSDCRSNNYFTWATATSKILNVYNS